MSLIKEYFDHLRKYEQMYGENVVVLMQVGHFYEVYGVETEMYQLGKIREIAKILSMEITRRKHKNRHDALCTPLMMGFPCFVLEKYLPLLMESNYTVIIIDQTSKDKIIREVKEVVSPSTYISDERFDSFKTNWLVVLIFDFSKEKEEINVGISVFDAVTGKSFVYECLWKDALTFVSQYEVREIIFQGAPGAQELIKALDPIKHLELGNARKIMVHFKEIDPVFLKKEHQNAYLGDVFENKTLLSNLEFLGLDNMIYASLSYTLLIFFLRAHNLFLAKKLPLPLKIYDSNSLLLFSNALDQLDVPLFFTKINSCLTAMGTRLLRERLFLPVACSKELSKRYDQLENFLYAVSKEGRRKELEGVLRKITDIEGLRRKILIKPNIIAFISLYKSLEAVLELNLLDMGFLNFDIGLNNDEINKIKDFIRDCDVLSIDNLKEYKTDANFSHKINQYIVQSDKRTMRLEVPPLVRSASQHQIKKINKELLMIKNVEDVFLSCCPSIKAEYSVSMGYHFVCKKDHVGKLKKEIDDIIIYENKSGIKISHDIIEKSNRKILLLLEELKDEIKNYSVSFMEKMLNKYDGLLTRVITFIANIDVLQSLSRLSSDNGYCRPVIDFNSDSYFKAKGLRNALIEQIHKETKYVPNDVYINKGGMIVYSINACGKTSLIKACGLALLLAQMGSFVPSTTYKFSPYNKIMTRIKNDDNIIVGKSSFVSEMTDLRSILNIADKNTLVLADEITRGTEHVSGSSIFAASVITLARRQVNFIFTTHLHNVSNFISDLENVKTFHLTVVSDDKGRIVFERKLKEGVGESVYGLEICRHLNLDPCFLDIAFSIRDRILCHPNEPEGQGPVIKTSNYNKNKIMTKCEICFSTSSNRDTHHIVPRSAMSKSGGNDREYNLVCLCKKCHIKVHQNKITINGYKCTSEGIVLDYMFT